MVTCEELFAFCDLLVNVLTLCIVFVQAKKEVIAAPFQSWRLLR